MSSDSGAGYSSYPFAAIVGQELLKKALLLAAVDPTIGGVLIRGDKGTAKSTAVRGLAELLPPIAVNAGCAFNCQISSPLSWCEVCHAEPSAALRPVPFVNLPLGATEDRVLGTLDFERALKEGGRRFQPGLLAAAHRGILYIDEVNLLADHLVDVLLDAAAMGVNVVQREGLSVEHPARITLIGTMNPEEGDLRPQLLDRFGMMVEVAAPGDAAERATVVRSRLAYEAAPAQFREKYSGEQEKCRRVLVAAAELLPRVELDDALIDLISSICARMGVVSLRADIVMTKVVRALAALDGRIKPGSSDIKLAALLVLAHRKRVNPLDNTGFDQDNLDQALRDLDRPDDDSGSGPSPSPFPCPSPDHDGDALEETTENDPSECEQDFSDLQNNHPEKTEKTEQIFSASPEEFQAGLRLEERSSFGAQKTSSGLRNKTEGNRGRYVRAELDRNPASLAVDATIRHAVLNNPHGETGEFKVTAANLHGKVRQEQQGALVILLVDASGSMAAMRRMEAVKGAALALLEDAYRKRDQVSVIAFRGAQAELLLAPTRSVQVAGQALQSLPTGGRTPLAHGLKMAHDVAEGGRRNGMVPLLVVLTDGKGNVSLPQYESAELSTRAAAASVREDKIAAVVLDTEEGFVKVGLAAALAAEMGAECLALAKVTAEKLTMTVKSRLQVGSGGFNA